MTVQTTLRQERLANGLTVLIVPRPSVQVVTVDMWVATGSADEPPEINGVSHFLEHMLFKGTERYGVGQIDRAIEAVGGVINAGTSHDFTHYYVALAAEEFDTALHIIGEVIQHSTLDEEELNRERQVILEEYYRKQDDPQGVLWENLYERMFARGPYKAPVLGLPETLEAIGRPQMLDYYERHYAPANMALLIVGNVDPDAALRKVEEQMGAFERPFRPLLDRNALTTDYARQVEYVIEKDVNETYCALAFPAPALRDAREAYAIDVMQFVLGGGHASLLYQEVKEKRQLATSIGAGYPSSRFDDIFYIYATCQEDKRREMEQAVLEQIERVAQSASDAESLDRARRLLINSHAFSLETTNGQSSSIGYYYTVTGSTDFERRYAEGIAAVTAEDVQEQARRWLRPEAMNRVLVRPKAAGGAPQA